MAGKASMKISELFVIRNKIKPQAGRIIISEPLLHDGFFGRAVVLLTENNDTGSLGFILNKPTGLAINSFVSECSSEEYHVYVGGPVATNTLHFIHTLGNKIPRSRHIKDNLYWGGDFDLVKRLINSDTIQPKDIRFFVGYSGWSPGQLDGELKRNSWLISEINTSQVMFPDDENLWKLSVMQTSERYKFWLNIPVNPNLN